ncbi:MAG: peptidoglycan editing factor PgeF [Gammaproteobacteria bacterium]|nr:peptidoglycan editing factor PgeF [Gammaproteobacteria bacterium]
MELIIPDWPAPNRVRAVITTRSGGVSGGPYLGLNLGDHVGDDAHRVAENRARLRSQASLPAEPRWLNQVHGCAVAQCGFNGPAGTADAATAVEAGVVCAVLTADCLPVLLCNRQGSRVAVVHAGWRGLAAGVIEAAISAFDDHPSEILAWLGPAIGPKAFEVGTEVRTRFVEGCPSDASCFQAHRTGHWLADIYRLARNRLNRVGLLDISGGGDCTFSDPERFYSFRRDGITGRMATLIWLTE